MKRHWICLPAFYALGILCSPLWQSLAWGCVLLAALGAGLSWLQLQGLKLRRCGRLVACLSCLCWLLGVTWGHWRQPLPSPSDLAHLAPIHPLQLSGQITGDVESRGAGKWRLKLKKLALGPADSAQPVAGEVLVYFKQADLSELLAADRIQIRGQLERPQPAMNFGAFSYRQFLAQQGVFSVAYAQHWERLQVGPSWHPERLLQQSRQHLLHGLERHLPLGTARLLGSLVVGEGASPVPADIKDLFQAVSLQHVLAVSGFQVQLVILALLGLGYLFKFPRGLCFAVALSGLWLFVALTGGPPSVLRAATAASLGLIGFWRFRKLDPVWGLVLGCTLLLLWDPQMLFQIGFQFSVLATWGLILTTPPLFLRLQWLPLPVAGLVAPVLAAQLWVLPAQLYHFGTFSWLFLPANLIAGLFTTALTWLALVGMLGGALLPWLQVWLLWPAQLLTDLLLWILRALLHLPEPVWNLRPLPLASLALSYAVLLLAVLAWHHRAVRRLLLALAVSVPLIGAGRGVVEQITCPLRVTYLSVGQGDAVLIEAAGQHILLDAGPRWPVAEGFADAGQREILPYLQVRGIRKLDLVILSHPQLGDTLCTRNHDFDKTPRPPDSARA